MKEEAEAWLTQSEEDLGTAEDCLKIKRFKAAAFYSHQAAEKALKAVQIGGQGRFDKIHDLVRLAAKVDAPKEVAESCAKLNPYYIVPRYPDAGLETGVQAVTRLPAMSRRVVEWARQALKQ
ncbi:MAG: HEPN domain-containing protein [Chloroflexi bacterium]|nr:HEPN domain-containing protein [Chloroflexota bacterium]